MSDSKTVFAERMKFDIPTKRMVHAEYQDTLTLAVIQEAILPYRKVNARKLKKGEKVPPSKLDRRFGMIPNGYNRIARVSGELDRLICDLVLTMPEEQRGVFMKQIVRGGIHIEVKTQRDPPSAMKNKDGLWMPVEDLNFLLQVGLEHCQFCECPEQDQKSCAFGKLMDKYFIDKVSDVGCGYSALYGMMLNRIDEVDEKRKSQKR